MLGPSSKWKTISEKLGAKIHAGEWPAGHRVANETEIAEQWGVSRPTAHRALAELQRQGLVVRQRRHGTVVADLRKRDSHLVALIFDHVAKQFDFPQGELIQGIQEVLGENFSTVWCDSMDDPIREANFLRRMSKETDGIICFPTSAPANTPLMSALHCNGTPLVLLDRVPMGFEGVSVISDDRDATYESIHLLAKKGHTRIGFLGFNKPTVSSATTRYESYLEAMRDLGAEDPSPYCRWFLRELEHEPIMFRQAMRDCLFALLNEKLKVTAIYCVQDSFANEAALYCEELGLRIPEDLELVVVNEWPAHLLKQSDRMHRIVRRKREIGTMAAQQLLRLRADERHDESFIRIPAELFPAGGVTIYNERVLSSTSANGG